MGCGMNRRPWEQWEIDYLERHFYGTQLHVICLWLDRSQASVYSMANRLGLDSLAAVERRKYRGEQQAWMPDEIRFMKQHYAKGDWEFLCKRPGRSKQSIKAKALRMGLFKL